MHVGGGGGCGLVGECAREGDGGAVSSAAERHRAADRAGERLGLAKVGRGAQGARGVGGAAVSGGARTPLGGDESRRASSTGANPGGGGEERHAFPSRPNRTGTGPAGWIPGGRAGLGTGAPGPGSLVVVGRRGGDRAGLWAAAGEGGVEGPGGLGGEPRQARGGWARAPEGGRSLRGWGGGVAPCLGCAGAPRGAVHGRSPVGRRRGAAVWCRAGVQRVAAQGCSVGPRRSAAWGRVRARHGAAQGCGGGLRRDAAWGCEGAQRGAAHGRGMGSGRGAVAWGRAGAQRGPAQRRSSTGLRRGAAWGCAGAQQRGAAQGRSIGMQIRSEFNLNSPNSLRIRSQREFAPNSA